MLDDVFKKRPGIYRREILEIEDSGQIALDWVIPGAWRLEIGPNTSEEGYFKTSRNTPGGPFEDFNYSKEFEPE